MQYDFFVTPIESAEAGSSAKDGLYGYQANGYDAVYNAYLDGPLATMCVLFAGGGKTRLASAIAADWPGSIRGVSERVLFLAHRDELISQGRGALSRAVGTMVDTEKAEERSSKLSRIVVGSVQTLQQQRRLDRFKHDDFGLVVLDEAHRASGTPSYKRIIDHFHGARFLYLTATPMRSDKKSMGLITKHVAINHGMAWGIHEGYILEPEVHSIYVDSIDISNVSAVAGELNKEEMDAVMSVEKTQRAIARAPLDTVGNRTTILFSGPSVGTAERLTEILNDPDYRPGCAKLVHAGTPEEERREVKKQHEAGKFQILVNVGIYTEGYDSPQVSAIVLARMTKSRTLLEQMACRGDRLLPGIGQLPTKHERLAAIASSAKPKFLVVDFHGNMGRHDLPSLVDVFAGDYAPAVQKAAKELLKKEPMTPEEALERAAASEEKKETEKFNRAAMRRAKLKVNVRWSSKVYNPFSLLGVPEAPTLARDEPLASPSQVAMLERAGLKAPLEGWRSATAREILGAIEARRAAGLATPRQAITLGKMGVDTSKMTTEMASYMVGALFANKEQHKFWGWLPGQKERILKGARS